MGGGADGRRRCVLSGVVGGLWGASVACSTQSPAPPAPDDEQTARACGLVGQISFALAGAFGDGVLGNERNAVLVPRVEGYPALPWAVGTVTDIVAVVREQGPALDLSLSWRDPTSALSVVAELPELRCDHPVIDGTLSADAPGEAVLDLREHDAVLDSFPLVVRSAESLAVFAVEDVEALLDDADAGAILSELYSGVPDWATSVPDGFMLEVSADRTLVLLAMASDAQGNALYSEHAVRWSFPDGIADEVPEDSVSLVALAPGAGQHTIEVEVGPWASSFMLVAR